MRTPPAHSASPTAPLRTAAALVVLLIACAPAAAQPGSCALPARDATGRESLGTCVNTELDEAVPQISADGRTLYFTRRYAPENTGGSGDPDEIWVSQRSADGVWERPRRQDAPLNHGGPSWVISAPLGNRSLLLANVVDPAGRLVRGVSLSRLTGTTCTPASAGRTVRGASRGLWAPS